MSEEAKNDINEKSLKTIFDLYSKIKESKRMVKSSIVEITEEDLKPKRKKRGSKN